MNISSTDKIDNTDKTNLSGNQAETTSGGEKPGSTDENQQGMVPLQIDSTKAPVESALQVYQPAHLVENRPVSSSNLEIYGTFRDCGVRPISSSHLEGSETFNDSGIRPVSPSHLHISKTYKDAGLRPVASNEIDNAQNLIDFLD